MLILDSYIFFMGYIDGITPGGTHIMRSSIHGQAGTYSNIKSYESRIQERIIHREDVLVNAAKLRVVIDVIDGLKNALETKDWSHNEALNNYASCIFVMHHIVSCAQLHIAKDYSVTATTIYDVLSCDQMVKALGADYQSYTEHIREYLNPRSETNWIDIEF